MGPVNIGVSQGVSTEDKALFELLSGRCLGVDNVEQWDDTVYTEPASLSDQPFVLIGQCSTLSHYWSLYCFQDTHTLITLVFLQFEWLHQGSSSTFNLNLTKSCICFVLNCNSVTRKLDPFLPTSTILVFSFLFIHLPLYYQGLNGHLLMMCMFIF